MQVKAKSRNSPQRQRGIAILTVLVIVALVVTLATVILARQSRSVRQMDNFQSLERAWHYAFTMEQFAILQLRLDAKTNKYDALTDRWAYQLPTQVLNEESGATVRFTGKLEDMQGRLNLNNLLDKEKEGALNGEYLKLVPKFISNAGLPKGFSEAIIDWVDKDSQPFGVNGAERDFYLAGTIPYLPANMPFVDPSELRLLRLEIFEADKKRQALERLQSMVSTLPFRGTTINPNTASPEVLKALGLSADQVSLVVEKRRNKQVYKSKDNFLREMGINNNTADDKILSKIFDTQSQYFRLTGTIEINRARVFLNTLLFRGNKGEVRVIMRQFDRVNETITANRDASNTSANTE